MESINSAVTSVKNMAGYGDNTEGSTNTTDDTTGTTTTDNTSGPTSTETTGDTTAHGYKTGGGASDESTSDTTAHGYKTSTDAATTESSAPATTSDETAKEPEKKEERTKDDVQSKAQGSDPNLEGPPEAGTGKVKMVGTGAPGSHSALFGLTPDGHKETESSSKTTAPAPSEEDAKEEKKGEKTEETGSRAEGGERVTEQMHDPKVDKKGHEDA